jgi:hypothetical protein
MAGITLAQAEEMLAAYMAAEEALLTGGQEYMIKDRRFRRGDLAAVQAGVALWDTRVKELSRGQSGRRVRGMTPG